MARAHLLVVDDEPSILTTLQKALTLEGYAVDVAGGVKVAEEKLKKRSYDLCLFDVTLPDGNGLDLLQFVRGAKLDTPVVMMSGHATIDTAVKATKLGAIQFVDPLDDGSTKAPSGVGSLSIRRTGRPFSSTPATQLVSINGEVSRCSPLVRSMTKK